jgi:3-hydroxyisobutyrate dehydrogenase
MKKVGFIGTGVMGKSMARHIMNAGYDLHIYTRTKAKAEDLLEEGAHWQDSPADLAQETDAVITMVGWPSDVEEVFLKEKGLLQNARKGTLLIDMTTSSPQLAEKLAREAEAAGMLILDAPVSGGDTGARNAELAVMCGGEKEAFEKARPLFELSDPTSSISARREQDRRQKWRIRLL